MASSGDNSKRLPFVRRLVLKDYKSIAACDLWLNRFSVFVGPNGAGKSNILDSLRLVSDSLRNSLEYALLDRGGLAEVRRRSKGHPRSFGIRLEMNLPTGSQATYAFQVGVPKPGAFAVQEEMCRTIAPDPPYARDYYHVRKGRLVDASLDLQSAIEPDRLYLGAVSALSQFRPVYDGLTRMGFYNLNPERIRDLQSPDPADVLARDGRNVASIINKLGPPDSPVRKRIGDYLETVVPGVKGVDVKHLGPRETIEFRQDVPGDENPWRFLGTNMSDGTLRVLGVLVSLFQGARQGSKPIPLVGIEEPESAIHPAAAHALAGAILEATEFTQVLVTSHSPDLLDHEDVRAESVIAVASHRGQTIAGPIDEAAREAVKENLYTPGELLRIQQVEPVASLFEKATSQPGLFTSEVADEADDRNRR